MEEMKKIMEDFEAKKKLFDFVKNNNLNRNNGAFLFDSNSVIYSEVSIKWVPISFFKEEIPIEREIINDIQKCGKDNLVLVKFNENNLLISVTLNTN